MNYQSAANLAYSQVGQIVPIEVAWNRVNYGLAGYGLLVGGSISDAVGVDSSASVAETCQASGSVVETCQASSSVESA